MGILRRKALAWTGSSLKDLRQFPDAVKDAVGHALDTTQLGGKPPSAKPLVGFKGADVLEIVDNYDSDTYRAVYTVQFDDIVYVLHAFQKKSKTGIKTPQKEIELVKPKSTTQTG